MNTKINRSVYGFTLIELLVVISIIAVLMSIMMPALGKARAQAKFTLCGNNQHQIVVGVSTYAADNNGRYPETIQRRKNGSTWTYCQIPYNLNYHSINDETGGSTKLGGGGGSVGLQLYNYLPDVKIWFCPFTKSIDMYEGSSITVPDRYRYGSANLSSTNMLLWNYEGWNRATTIIGGERRGFSGGGDKSKNTLILAEVIFWGYQFSGGDQLNHWWATHPFKGATADVRAYVKKDDGGGAPNARIPDFLYKLNAGYIDGSVRRYDAEQTSRVGASGESNFIPAMELWR